MSSASSSAAGRLVVRRSVRLLLRQIWILIVLLPVTALAAAVGGAPGILAFAGFAGVLAFVLWLNWPPRPLVVLDADAIRSSLPRYEVPWRDVAAAELHELPPAAVKKGQILLVLRLRDAERIVCRGQEPGTLRVMLGFTAQDPAELLATARARVAAAG